MLSENETSKNSSAWLLSVAAKTHIAIANNVFAEYIVMPKLYKIPSAVTYCCEALYWRDTFVPVFDFSVLLGGTPLNANHIAVLAYQELMSEKVKHLAIKLDTQTEKIIVTDESACDWPKDYHSIIQPLVTSLFMHASSLVCIINLSDLCNESYRDYVHAYQKKYSSP